VIGLSEIKILLDKMAGPIISKYHKWESGEHGLGDGVPTTPLSCGSCATTVYVSPRWLQDLQFTYEADTALCSIYTALLPNNWVVVRLTKSTNITQYFVCDNPQCMQTLINQAGTPTKRKD